MTNSKPIFRPTFGINGFVPLTLNEDDEKIMSLIKQQRSERGRIAAEKLESIIRE